MTEIFIPKELAKDRKKREKMQESGGSNPLTEEQLELRRSETSATVIVPKLKNYTAARTLEILISASKLTEQESKREAHLKLCINKFGDESTAKRYIAAVEQAGGGVMVPLSMAEEKRFKTKQDLKGKRGKSYLVHQN